MERLALVTGATGFLGSHLVRTLLEGADTRVACLVRPDGARPPAERLAYALQAVGAPAARGRLEVVEGDITQEGLGLPPADRARLQGAVTEVLHAAASVLLTLPLPAAREANVEGTRQVLAFAGKCRQLRALAHVSTAYVAGDRQGPIREAELDRGQGFLNPYERSKFEAELLLRAQADALPAPLTIFRPSIVVGDSRTGRTHHFPTLYFGLRMAAEGYVPILPRRLAPLDVVPVDYVAAAMGHVLAHPTLHGRTYHLTAGPARSLTFREMAEAALRVAGNGGRRGPLPLPAGPLFALAVALLRALAGPKRRRRYDDLLQFVPYLRSPKAFDDAHAQAALRGTGIRVPPLADYLERLLLFCLRTGWGSRPAAAEDAAGPRGGA